VADCDALLTQAAGELADPDLGLKAALHTQVGDFEALEWVAMSAPTWREANAVVARYCRILSSAAEVRTEVCGNKAHLILGSALSPGRVALDYALAMYHLAIQLRVHEVPEELEVWFEYETPDDLSAHLAIFPGARLEFRAAFSGFVTDAARLDAPLPTANVSLHGVLRAHAEHLLAELASGDHLSARVSAYVLEEMPRGGGTADRAAAQLCMTRRNLTRRLREEGTSFSKILQQTRYRTACHYLVHGDQSVEDIAFLLGYSECSPFVRAFRRWSGYAPHEYRLRR